MHRSLSFQLAGSRAVIDCERLTVEQTCQAVEAVLAT
jgi:hypothetical protein